MQFEVCAHGNIALTCPQCRRGQSAPVMARPAPAAVNEHARTLDLGIVIDRAVDQIDRTGARQAAGVKAFWSQINRPTTIADHEADHS